MSNDPIDQSTQPAKTGGTHIRDKFHRPARGELAPNANDMRSGYLVDQVEQHLKKQSKASEENRARHAREEREQANRPTNSRLFKVKSIGSITEYCGIDLSRTGSWICYPKTGVDGPSFKLDIYGMSFADGLRDPAFLYEALARRGIKSSNYIVAPARERLLGHIE